MPSVGVLELVAILTIAAIWLAIPVAVIVLIMRRARRTATVTPAGPDPALAVLRSRLASGEIDQFEYRRLRSALHRG